MATMKQKRAVKKILENPRLGISTIMRSPEVGYSPNTAVDPRNLTESKGFKEAMAEYGLTEEFITKSLVFDIENKPKHRFLELNLGAEILGMKDHEIPRGGVTNNFTQIIINPPHERKIADDKSN